MAFPLINPTSQFFDSSGSPLASGTIEFRNPDTNALIDSFPTADDADAQTNANANPLTLNSRGEAASGLYLEDGVKYKVILKDSSGTTIWTQDDVRCPVNPWYGVQTAAESTAGVTPTNVEYPPGDVRRYGAALDGTTDDSSALQDAGDTGYLVYIPDGTLVATAISWSSNVEIFMEDGAKILHKASAAADLITASANLIVCGGSIDGNKGNQTSRLDLIESTGTECVIKNVHFQNSVKSAVNINGVSGRAVVRDCYFTGMAEHSGTSTETSKCIDTNGTVPVIELKSNVCIGDTPSVNTNAPGGFFLSGTSQSARITNNYFKNIGQNNGSDQISCIQLYTDADESIIANNVCEDSYFSPIRAQNANNTTLTGNVIRGYSGAASALGMILYGHARTFATDISRCTITGNVIDVSGDTDVIGIYVTGDSAGTLLTEGAVVSGNVIDGGNEGIRVEWFTECNINNNIVRGQGGASSRGILVNNLSDKDAVLTAIGNTFYDAGSVHIQCIDTDNNDDFSCNISSNTFYVVLTTPSYFVQVRGASGAQMENVVLSGNLARGTASSDAYEVHYADTVTVTGNIGTGTTTDFDGANNTTEREVGNSWQALQTYTPSNVVTNRSYDADTVVIADLADVVGTLIADLQAQGTIK